MAKQENRHPYQDGTEHGYLSFGEVNTFSNEIDACKIANGCLLYTSPSPRD